MRAIWLLNAVDWIGHVASGVMNLPHPLYTAERKRRRWDQQSGEDTPAKKKSAWDQAEVCSQRQHNCKECLGGGVCGFDSKGVLTCWGVWV